jgi:alpha-beta hydrolase superfamily lysophospholipase
MTRQVHRVEVGDGQSVAVDWYPAGTNTRAALFVPGLGSNRRGEKATRFAERFNENGWAFAALDLRGHGHSDGSMRDLTMSRMLADVSASIAWIGERAAGGSVLIGSSLGAAVIAWYAAAREAVTRPLVMIAPTLHFPASLASALDPDELDRWRHTGVHRLRNQWIDVEVGFGLMLDGEQYDPAELMRRHAAPTLILHGMRDETVDWKASAEFARRCHAPVDLFLVGEGDHRLTDHKELLFDVLWSWLRQTGNAGRRRARAG